MKVSVIFSGSVPPQCSLKYLADCGGKWGELSYNFKDDTAEILLLAEWDTILSHRFAMRAIAMPAEMPPLSCRGGVLCLQLNTDNGSAAGNPPTNKEREVQ